MTSDPLFIVAVLGANVALSEWLARTTFLRHLGSALLVIVLTALVANLGGIPTAMAGHPVYDGIFDYVGPLAIFWLLLRVNLGGILKAGVPMIGLFLAGSLGTVLGVLAGMAVAGGPDAFGELHFALGGMFVGTYTGGSVNFNAVALQYGVAENGPLFAGASVVDSAMTTLWMVATVALPRIVAPFWPRLRSGAGAPGGGAERAEGSAAEDEERVGPTDIGVVLALGAGSVALAGQVTAWLRSERGVVLPEILVLTTLALVLAQLRPVQRLRGTRLCGMFAVLVFLAVIGALCDVSALREIGDLGVRLSILVVVAVLVHGVVIFAAAALLRLDPAAAAVASQANIGGATSALALARSLGRGDLVLPGILVGVLGMALGNYLGFAVAAWLA